VIELKLEHTLSDTPNLLLSLLYHSALHEGAR
jgi:hypothetical protein